MGFRSAAVDSIMELKTSFFGKLYDNNNGDNNGHGKEMRRSGGGIAAILFYR